MTNIHKCNNNIIFAEDKGQQVIALGKGLGFSLKPGDEVDMSLVEKVFVPQEALQLGRFQDILADLPYEHVILASKIVDLGRARLGQALNQSIVIALADHLSFAIKRQHDHLDIQMPLIWDIKHIYPAEFAVGEEALGVIKAETGIDFPRAEAAAITLHFINAESDLADMPNTIKMSNIIQQSVRIIEAHYKTSFDESSLDFSGLIALLRNTVMRFIYPDREKQIEEDTVLYQLLRKRYAHSFTCAEKVASFIEREYDFRLSGNDVSFLTLFIDRITAGSGSDKG
ncbi:MAG: PRD domain-containing protein [Spirochaetaceae bacterium]|jgi:beta-glucoside operon transcriptional antiterminator|nr:PRD domain-containing protein [Spirochaetaceae bacterium]